MRIGPPLYIRGKAHNETGDGWGTLFEWSDPKGTPKRHVIHWKMMSGSYQGWSGELADRGWFPDPEGKKWLDKYVAACDPGHWCTTTPRTGWIKGRFVFPDTVLGDSDGEEVFFIGNMHPNPYQTHGTLQGWQDTIGTWSGGNNRLVFMLSAAFAPILFDLLRLSESFIFNYVGDSSIGKSITTAAAGSVWGKGDLSSDGYILTWRSTDNGLEGEAMRHNDTVLCLDEMALAAPDLVATGAYMIAAGKGKLRSKQDGSAAVPNSWRCVGLSSNEEPLTEVLAAHGIKVKAGQTVRIVDIPADAGADMGLFEDLHGHDSSGDFAKALSAAAITNYGHASRAFIKKIQEDPEWVADWVRHYMEKKKPTLYADHVDPQVQRVADKFLLCAAAGRLAAGWKIVPWEKGEALEAAQACFRAWIRHRGGIGGFDDMEAKKLLLSFLEQHEGRFQPLRDAQDGKDASKYGNLAGFKKKLKNGTVYYILPETFREEVYRGMNYRRAAEGLVACGLMMREKKGYTRHLPVELPGLGRVHCFIIVIKHEDDQETD